MPARWGVDLGGTKIEAVVLEDDRTLARRRLPTEAHLGYEHVLGQISRLIELLESETGRLRPATIGFGTPGTIDPSSGTMINCNTVCLNGQPLQRDLSQILNTEARLANDANCFAIGEATLGAAKGAGVVFGVIMGTGVGGGIVVNGSLLNGAMGIAGEWGHNVLDPTGDPCYCGKRGCVETVLSGPALERYYRSQTGTQRSLKDVVQDADDPARGILVDHLVASFGEALAVVVNILDPDVIVLGGGVGNIQELYDFGPEELAKHVFSPHLRTRLVRPKLGDSAGVFGAALLS